MKKLLAAVILSGMVAACSSETTHVVVEGPGVAVDAERSAALSRLVALSATTDPRNLSMRDRIDAEAGCGVIATSTVVVATNPQTMRDMTRFCQLGD